MAQMMNVDLQALIHSISAYDQAGLNRLLDQRDQEPFEVAWLAARASVPEGQRPELVEKVFLAVSKATNHHELASYMADDLDLLSDAEQHEARGPFLDFIALCYARGKIPSKWEDSDALPAPTRT